MATCNPAPSPGVSHMKATTEDEAPLDHDQHKQHRRLVGKMEWLAHTHGQTSAMVRTSKITTVTNTT